MSMIDPEDGYDAPPRRKRGVSFGTIGRTTIKCAGADGKPCRAAGTIKGGKLWYCHWHAPRGSEG